MTTERVKMNDLNVETFEAGSLMVLHQEWIGGSNDDESVTFTLLTGAGLGHALVVLDGTVDGTVFREAIDFAEVTEAWVEKIEHRIRGTAPEPVELHDRDKWTLCGILSKYGVDNVRAAVEELKDLDLAQPMNAEG